MTKKRKALSIFLLFFGFTLAFMFIFFSKELLRIEVTKNVYSEQKIKYKEKVINDLNLKTEEVVRGQIRLNLNSTRDSIEKVSKLFKIDMTAYNNRIKITEALTSEMRYFDKEGDTFIVNSNGVFDLDDSTDCGQPLSLVYTGKPLLDIPNRERTFNDEIAWQYELKYILYSQGIIGKIDKFIIDSATEKIDKTENYKVDRYLSNVKLFKTQEIEYIEINYPKIFSILKKYKVIMHSDYQDVEPVNNFFEKQIDSEKGTNLGWYFNPKPYKEILEIVWIPGGKAGFNEESKNYAGGTPNPNYLKIGLVQGAQIHKILNEYSKIYEGIENQCDNDIKIMNDFFIKEKRNIEFMALVILILFLALCFAMIQIILNSKER